MLKRVIGILLILTLAVSFSTVVFAQDAAKKEMKKDEMKKGEKMVFKSVTCGPECGFMCRSHDEKELTAIVKKHAETAHKMKMSDKEIKGMMKTEEGGEMKN